MGEGDDVTQPFPGDAVAANLRLTIDDLRLMPDSTTESSIINRQSSIGHPLFGRRVRMAGASDYLRTQAISRLYLDNIHSIGSSWVTMGPHIGQVALHFGASDMGSVMMEENVVSAAGTTHCLNEPMLCRLIRDAGFMPAQRNNEYNLLKVHDSADSPDLRVEDWSKYRAQMLHVETAKSMAAESSAVALTVDSRSAYAANISRDA